MHCRFCILSIYFIHLFFICEIYTCKFIIYEKVEDIKKAGLSEMPIIRERVQSTLVRIIDGKLYFNSLSMIRNH